MPHTVPVETAATAFELEGTIIEGGSNRAFVLDEKRVWLVVNGSVDVFTVPLANGEIKGARRHLHRFGEGDVLFGIEPGRRERGIGFLAVGMDSTALAWLPFERVRELDMDPQAGPIIASYVRNWVGALSASIGSDLVPKGCRELPVELRARLVAGSTFRPDPDVVWLRHIEGSSALLGDPNLQINGGSYLPIGRSLWLETIEDSRIEARAFTDAPPPNEIWAGLARLHLLIVAAVAQRIEAERLAELERSERREKLNRVTRQEAYRGLANVLADRRHGDVRRGPPTKDAELDPLLDCCRVVADKLKLQLTVPADVVDESIDNRLKLIADASGFRIRRVGLRENWWHDDNGPLMASIHDGGNWRPVVLMPKWVRGYLLYDPSRDAELNVTPDLAARMAPFAYSFYRPFKETRLNIKDIVQFSLQGCGREIALIATMACIAGLLQVATPIMTGWVYNTVIPAAGRGRLMEIMLLLLVVSFSRALFLATRRLAMVRLAGKSGAAVQAAVWDRLVNLPMPFFRSFTAGNLASRAMGVGTIWRILTGTTMEASLSFIFAVFNYALLFHYSAQLAIWATVLVGTTLAISLWSSYYNLRCQRQITLLRAEISGLILQLLTGISKVRVAGAESHAFALWAERFGRQRRLQYQVGTVRNGVESFNAGFPVLASALIFGSAVTLTGDGGTVRTGDLLAFMSAYTIYLSSTLAMGSALLSLLNVVPHYENAKPILHSLPEGREGKAAPGMLSGRIEVQKVSFRYSPSDPYVFREISFHVEPGQFVAFVGPSGSGKSTLLRLLLGFEAVENGSIYYDGQDLGGLDLRAVRRQIGVVLQNGRLMAGDVLTNIIGSSGATPEEAREAARMVGFDADVRQMPMGMHTIVGEGGALLSGGQRQRLQIARAIVSRPRILYFDEATSALDNNTQSIVSESLAHLKVARLIIAHRLTTIAQADKILVLGGGRIAESGSYDELMDERGAFFELARRQLV